MNVPAPRWTGKDLTPLPFESDMSCLLRFAWRNALEFKLLKQHFSAVKARFCLDRTALQAQVGWRLHDGGRHHLGYALDPAMAYWLADEFRYCPVCLECGFHSDLFQCVAILACPFHAIELSSHCHCCGRSNPTLSEARRLLDRPYCCDGCGGPISGVPPSLEAHLDFRASHLEVKVALQTYFDWFMRTGARRQEVTEMRVDRCPGLQAQWCDIAQFMRAVACKGEHAPPCARVSHYPDCQIVYLDWRYRVAHGPPNDYFRKTWPDRTSDTTAQAVYRSTLRSLARWIACEQGWTGARFESEIKSFRIANASQFSTAFLAFFSFRCHLESRYSPCEGEDLWPQAQARLDSNGSCDLASYHGRIPRLALKARLLALYASWFERIAHLDCVSITTLRELACEDRLHIFLREKLRHRQVDRWCDGEGYNGDETFFEGEVNFLKIAGMPLWPWDRHAEK